MLRTLAATLCGVKGSGKKLLGLALASALCNTLRMSTHETHTAAAAVFAGQSTHDVKTVFVSTFVQVGRFTDSEGATVRAWAFRELTAREGFAAARDFAQECGF